MCVSMYAFTFTLQPSARAIQVMYHLKSTLRASLSKLNSDGHKISYTKH